MKQVSSILVNSTTPIRPMYSPSMKADTRAEKHEKKRSAS